MKGGSVIEQNITDLRTLTDQQLVTAILKGNRDAFSRIVDRYGKLILGICLQRIGDYQEAENATQETLLSVYRSLSLYKGGSFKGWVARITVNKCNDFYRSKKHVELSSIDGMDGLELRSEEPELLELTAARIQAEQLRAVLQQLPEKYRVPVQGYYLEGKSVRQMAEEQNLPPKTMETRLYRGLNLLKKRKEELI